MIIKEDNLNINYIEEDKFNSNLLSIYIKRPLNREEVTINNLLVDVLSRGSKNYPDILTIERELERLYGASLTLDTNTLGNFQLLNFSIQFVNEKFVEDKKYFLDIINLLTDIVFNPKLINGKFDPVYVEGEKKNLRKKIENEINDKRSYAINRTISEMFKGEVYGISKDGYLEDIEKIDYMILTEHYKDIIRNSEIQIYYLAEENQEHKDQLEESFKRLQLTKQDINKILMLRGG